ncbi:MAG: hypothetical protein EXQ47_00025 [Bryobacterales bacterium]|nr:hypothetical protein [Bryobacterales bacterium]
MKMTRRALAGMAALSAVPLTKSAAQAPAKSAAQAPVPAAAPANSATRQFQDAARQLASVKLARTVEPAFRFEA